MILDDIVLGLLLVGWLIFTVDGVITSVRLLRSRLRDRDFVIAQSASLFNGGRRFYADANVRHAGIGVAIMTALYIAGVSATLSVVHEHWVTDAIGRWGFRLGMFVGGALLAIRKRIDLRDDERLNEHIAQARRTQGGG
mgnify:CR=1 FL=1